MGRFVQGILGTGATLAVLGMSMGVVNYSLRAWASRRLTSNEHDLNAEAILLMF